MTEEHWEEDCDERSESHEDWFNELELCGGDRRVGVYTETTSTAEFRELVASLLAVPHLFYCSERGDEHSECVRLRNERLSITWFAFVPHLKDFNVFNTLTLAIPTSTPDKLEK